MEKRNNNNKNFENMTIQEVMLQLEEYRRELFSLRLHAPTKPQKDHTLFKKLRKNIARSLTYINQNRKK